MGRTRRPPLPSDNAAIARKLRTDSETLRYAEWWVRRRIYGFSDQEARWLYERYLDSYREMTAILTSAYDLDGNPNLLRRAELLSQIEREMNRLVSDVESELDRALVEAYQQGYAGRGWVLDTVTGKRVPVRLPMLPVEAIRALLIQPALGRADRRYQGYDWHVELGLTREEFITRVRRSLTSSMIQGEGIRKAQRRLREELGIETDRRRGFRRNFYQTLLLTRTEIMRASNLGALAVYEANQDILRGWEWVATRDERTCPTCAALDSKVFRFDSPQLQPPSGSHPGCRCTVVPVLRNEDLMREVEGEYETYAQWRARTGIDDGGLDGQRGSDAHGINQTGADRT